MNRLLIYLFVFFCSISCLQKQKSNSLNESGKFVFSVIDSLNKYSERDSISIPFKVPKTYEVEETSDIGQDTITIVHDTLEAELCINTANKIRFAYTRIGDDLVFYHKSGSSWVITDSTDFHSPMKLKKIDLNGDNLLDLRFSYLYNKENGDFLTEVFIYNPEQKLFKPNSSFCQSNIEYDKHKKFVRFSMGIEKGKGGVKWKGIVVGDRLVVDSTITYLDYSYDSKRVNTGIIKIFKGSNGVSNTPVKIIRGTSDSLWLIFSTTFWNSDNK